MRELSFFSVRWSTEVRKTKDKGLWCDQLLEPRFQYLWMGYLGLKPSFFACSKSFLFFPFWHFFKNTRQIFNNFPLWENISSLFSLFGIYWPWWAKGQQDCLIKTWRWLTLGLGSTQKSCFGEIDWLLRASTMTDFHFHKCFI